MLGLMSAHALLQRKRSSRLLSQVTANLERILGLIPDVIALKLAVDPNATVPTVEFPPMLQWSWQLLLQRSVERPHLIRRQSLAEQVGSHVYGRGVWMSWITDSGNQRFSSATPPPSSEVITTPVRRAWRQMNQRPSVRMPRSKNTAEDPASRFNARDRPDAGVSRSVIEEAVGSLTGT